MERNILGHIDALIHLSCFAAEVSRCSFEAMKNDAETRLEAASRNAKIAIVRNVVFANATGSWRRAIGNLVTIRTVRTSEISSSTPMVYVRHTKCSPHSDEVPDSR